MIEKRTIEVTTNIQVTATKLVVRWWYFIWTKYVLIYFLFFHMNWIMFLFISLLFYIDQIMFLFISLLFHMNRIMFLFISLLFHMNRIMFLLFLCYFIWTKLFIYLFRNNNYIVEIIEKIQKAEFRNAILKCDPNHVLIFIFYYFI